MRRSQSETSRPKTDSPRVGMSLIELTVVVLILSLGAAMVAPRWSGFRATNMLNNAAMAIKSDLHLLQSHAIRYGQDIQVDYQVGGCQLRLNPAVPTVLGGPDGVVDYGHQYPGITFMSVSMQGSNQCVVDRHGTWRNAASLQPLTTAEIEISCGNHSAPIRILQ